NNLGPGCEDLEVIGARDFDEANGGAANARAQELERGDVTVFALDEQRRADDLIDVEAAARLGFGWRDVFGDAASVAVLPWICGRAEREHAAKPIRALGDEQRQRATGTVAREVHALRIDVGALGNVVRGGDDVVDF